MKGEERNRVLERCCIRQRWLCPICRHPLTFPIEPHHAGVHDTGVNQRRWPHVVDHPINIVAVHKRCHEMHRNWGRWPGTRKADWMEARLSAAAERVHATAT